MCSNTRRVLDVKYLIVQCPNCGNYSIVKLGTQTRQCPYCGKRFKVLENIVAPAASLEEAREKLVRLREGGK